MYTSCCFGYLGKPIELIFLKEKRYFVYHQVLAKKRMKKAYFVRNQIFWNIFLPIFFISYQPTDAEFQVMQTKIVQQVVFNWEHSIFSPTNLTSMHKMIFFEFKNKHYDVNVFLGLIWIVTGVIDSCQNLLFVVF